jgi:transposase InsO family protein
VGTLKGVGRIYQQTFIDTCSKVAFTKLYDRRNALVAADLLNDRVVPFFDQQDVPLLRILTDRGTEFCGKREHHEYQLYLTLEDIDHSKTRARSHQSNGICEWFHKTVLDEFYRVTFRKKLYNTLDELCKKTWIFGYGITTKNACTAASTVLGKHRCKRSGIQYR